MRVCVELGADSAPPESLPDSIGGKARSLVRLAAAGLPVPRAFAVTGALFQALRAAGPALPARLIDHADLEALGRAARALDTAAFPDGFMAELGAQLDRLEDGDHNHDDNHDDAGAATGLRPFLTEPARFSVRSSFAGEDQRGALGAGVYASLVGVARADVPAAIRKVLASALSPGAVAYSHARGEDTQASAVAVLVHRFLDGEASGSAAWDPAGAAPPTVEVGAGTLAAAARERIDGALRALGAGGDPIEIEWVARGAGVVFLQLRGYEPAPAAARWAGADALADGGDWRWDAAHNPLPLSPAQAGLIALVEDRCRIGVRQRVAGGYLFYAAGGRPPARAIAPEDAADELARLGATVNSRLDALGDAPGLDDALDLFVTFYDPLFGAIQPALRRCRETLAAFLRERRAGTDPSLAALLAGVESVATERQRGIDRLRRAASDRERAAALRDYLARFGDESPVWDVARPTYREDPTALLAWLAPEAERTRAPRSSATSDTTAGSSASTRAAQDIERRLPAEERPTFATLLARARQAAALGEEDDRLYARAQAAVRKALLAQGARLAAQGLIDDAADVFWLPLDAVRALARGQSATEDATEEEERPVAPAALATAARAEHQRALASPPPSAGADSPGARALPRGVDQPSGRAIVGKSASGGRVIGRAWVHTHARPSGAPSFGAGAQPPAILIAPTLLPTELPLLQAAALVVETGGVLGHVAAQARERGIPAIVGAAGACAAFATGDLVLVDADAGVAVKLAGPGDSLYGGALPG